MNINNFTKTEQKIITLLSNYPNKEFFCRQIANKLNVSVGGVSESLRRLAKKKLIESHKQGNMKFYQIIEDNPVVKQYKINLAMNRINPLIKKLKAKSLGIILFGSASRGEQTTDSDIDLFVLTNHKGEVRKILHSASNKLSIKAVIKTANEWSELEVKEPEFYKEVQKGIKLYQTIKIIGSAVIYA